LFARDLERAIKSGKSFYEALMPYEDILGNVYVTLCRTGEESGALPETLDYLLNLLKKKESLRSKLIHMSVYPAILIVVLVIEFMLFGLGIFPTMIENLQIDQVPPIAMAFIAGASFVLKLWWLFVFTAIGGWLLLKFTIGFKAIKKSVGNFFAKIPLMKDCLKYFSLSHYMSVLYVAYEAGVPIVAALRMAEDTISVAKINEQAKSVTNHVGKGESITDAFYKSDMLPPVIMSMVSTGEKTGKLGQMFRDISIAVEQKLDAAISVMSKAFEPLLLLVVGAGVAVMAVAVIQMYISSLTSMF
jgi:type II secretory pathway component PulF